MGQTTRNQAIADGLEAIRQAYQQKRGATIPPLLLRFIGAQILYESNFGRNYGQMGYDRQPEVFWGTNNYGAFQPDPQGNFKRTHASELGWGEVQHRDNTKTGQPVMWAYRVGPTQLDMALDWMGQWLYIAETGANGGTTQSYAAAMFIAKYFTGTAGTSVERIANYAAALTRTLPSIDAVLASNLAPNDPSEPTGDDFAPQAQIVWYAGPLPKAPAAAPAASSSPSDSSAPPQLSPFPCSGLADDILEAIEEGDAELAPLATMEDDPTTKP